MKRTRKPDRRERTLFSVLKVAEGGPGLYARTILKDAGIDTEPGYSVYVGHVGFFVVGNKAVVRRAERILWH